MPKTGPTHCHDLEREHNGAMISSDRADLSGPGQLFASPVVPMCRSGSAAFALWEKEVCNCFGHCALLPDYQRKLWGIQIRLEAVRDIRKTLLDNHPQIHEFECKKTILDLRIAKHLRLRQIQPGH